MCCRTLGSLVLLSALAVPFGIPAAVYEAGPQNYRDLLSRLGPGDTLALSSGHYLRGLPVHHLAGAPGEPIRIEGPSRGPPAVFHGRAGHNTISIVNSEWVVIDQLEIDGQRMPGDGVKAEGHSDFAHHITLSNLKIHNLARHQAIIGISTKCRARGWVIRNVEITGAGTGMYLGDSDGTAPFIGGLVEHNLVTGSLGYAIQIKHQAPRPPVPDLPSASSRTIIRHNVLAKGNDSSQGSRARPNLLLGHFPATGPGAADQYLVYGNLIYNNPTERLFQGEGNIALYSNLLVNPSGDGVAIMPHKGHPRRVVLFGNTILTRGTGVIARGSAETQAITITGNAIWGAPALSLEGADASDNHTAAYETAGADLRAPFEGPGRFDFRPGGEGLIREQRLSGSPVKHLPGGSRDFEGQPRSGLWFGAYDPPRDPLQWQPRLEMKTLP